MSSLLCKVRLIIHIYKDDIKKNKYGSELIFSTTCSDGFYFHSIEDKNKDSKLTNEQYLQECISDIDLDYIVDEIIKPTKEEMWIEFIGEYWYDHGRSYEGEYWEDMEWRNDKWQEIHEDCGNSLI